MRWIRTLLRSLRVLRDEPTLVQQLRDCMNAPAIINGTPRQLHAKRIYYGPTCKWPIVKD